MERKRSDSLVRAQKRYDSTLRKVTIKFNRNTEKDLLEWLESVGPMQPYIKSLIRRDMCDPKRDPSAETV